MAYSLFLRVSPTLRLCVEFKIVDPCNKIESQTKPFSSISVFIA